MIVEEEIKGSVRKDWGLFSTAVFLFAFGFAIYSVCFVNYITEILHFQPIQMGTLESLREIPGLLAVGIAGILASYSETRVGAACLVLSAVGIAGTGLVHTFSGLVLVTVFWSIFMHQWFTSSSAIPLALSQGQEGGRHLGRMGAIGAGATVFAFIIVQRLVGHLSYTTFFLASAGFVLAGGLMLLPISSRATTVNRPRLLYRREYRTYYLLAFLEGCRRQIFTTFAIFALVQVCRVSLAHIALLMLLNAIATFLVAGPIGRLVDRLGEQRTMTIYYIGIAIAFTGYALATNTRSLEILYIIDNILFSFGVSITTYIGRTVRPGELMPTLSMGQTMNHIAAVVIPVSGGLLWHTYGYHAPFWVGVIAALMSLAITQRVGHRPVTENLPIS